MNTIALRLIGEVGWGLKMRVFVGAAISTLDLCTDIFMAVTYWNQGTDDENLNYDPNRLVFFKCTVVSLTVNMIITMMLVGVQNRRRGIHNILLELLWIPFGLKPAFDAWRVGSGVKAEEGKLLTPLDEMVYTKGVEMFAEAIPGVIIQLAAIIAGFLNNNKPTTAEFFSLAISALTSGYVSATMSYDMDTDCRQRDINPSFYGYVPNNVTRRLGTCDI